eukprot:PhF_6_TR9755/c0_g1_i1/m.15033
MYVQYVAEEEVKRSRQERLRQSRAIALNLGRSSAHQYRTYKSLQQEAVRADINTQKHNTKVSSLEGVRRVQNVAELSKGYAMRRAVEETEAMEAAAAEQLEAWNEYNSVVQSRAAACAKASNAAKELTHQALQAQINRKKEVRAREDTRSAAMVHKHSSSNDDDEEVPQVPPKPTCLHQGLTARERAIAEQSAQSQLNAEKEAITKQRVVEASRRGRESLQALRSQKDRVQAVLQAKLTQQENVERKIAEVVREPRMTDYMEQEARRSFELSHKLHKEFEKSFVRPDAGWSCVWATRAKDRVRYAEDVAAFSTTPDTSVSGGDSLLDYEPIS